MSLRVRAAIGLIAALACLSITPIANAGPLLDVHSKSPVPFPRVPVALAGACPTTGINTQRCAIGPVAGATLECVTGRTATGEYEDYRNTCGVTSSSATVQCGDTDHGFFSSHHYNISFTGCTVPVGTTAIALGCTTDSGGGGGGSFVAMRCGSGPITYEETGDSGSGPGGGTSETQTLTIGNVRYRCVDGACRLVTS